MAFEVIDWRGAIMTEPYYKQHWIDIDADRHATYEDIFRFHPAMESMLAALEFPAVPVFTAGLNVLDVGCGPGLMSVELARRVGPSGRVTGIDLNGDFVRRAAARAREDNLEARLDFRCGAFPPMPFADATFDRAWCKNVLEYVDSPDATVAEMARVLKPGALAVAVSSDWKMITLEVEPQAQTHSDRIIAAARRIALKDPKIGRHLYCHFQDAGLADVKLKVLAGPDTSGRLFPALKASFARYALDSGEVTEADIERWLDDILRSIERRRFIFMLPQFVVRGVKRSS